MIELQALWVANDLLAQGPMRLRLLSRHEHVANFIVEDQSKLLMIGDPSVYPGPSSLGLSYEGYRNLYRILEAPSGQVLAGKIRLESLVGEVTIRYGDAIRNFSVPANLTWEPQILRKSIKVASDLLSQASGSLATSLLKTADHNGASAPEAGFHEDMFLVAFREHVPILVRALAAGDESSFLTAVRGMIGLGPGSTPSGDDLIHGALVAYQYAQAAQGKSQDRPAIPLGLIEQTTYLGRHMLSIGQQGLTPEPVRDFLISLFGGQVNETVIARVGEIGASTGWDIATAALLMLRELNNERRECIGSTSIC